jgi:hypothetical protein
LRAVLQRREGTIRQLPPRRILNIEHQPIGRKSLSDAGNRITVSEFQKEFGDIGERMFDVEIKTFQNALTEELAGHANRYAVISGSSVLGVFDTYNDALAAGYRTRGVSPFLLKRVPTGSSSQSDRTRSYVPKISNGHSV